jgi:sugar phosphate isomerase/epimerase
MNASTSHPMTRRSFLHRTAATGAGLACSLAAPQAAESKKIPVGLQLYSVREQCAKNLPATLEDVARIGFRHVEFAGYHGRNAKDLRKLLDANGLAACGTHTPYESVLPARLQETIDFNLTIGNKFLIVPWMEAKSKQAWLDKAKQFNEIAQKLKPHGLLTGYHAHAHDFEKFDGQSAWDIFFGSTTPDVVMQLDTSNCLDGGADPVAVLKKYPGRALSIHLKAHGGGPEAVFGEDKVPWPAVFEFCETQGRTQIYVVEHESGKDPIAAVKRAYLALQKMGKV